LAEQEGEEAPEEGRKEGKEESQKGSCHGPEEAQDCVFDLLYGVA
jgi:hypothetical protein